MDNCVLPSSVGDYDLDRVIGRGCSSIVVHATNRRTKTTHAVKVISRSILEKELSLRSIEQELRLLTALKHPNLIRHDKVIFKEDFIYIVLEYCEKDLLTEMRSSFLSIKRIKAYMRDILSGLAYLHQRGIVHCDLKPENLFIAADGTLKIGDLGSCIDLGRPVYYATGTLRYMAPERFKNGGDFSVKSDIWSAAIVLLEMLNVSLPWDGVADKQAMAQLICDENTTYATAQLTAHLKDAVSKCLVHDPEKRPSASQLMELRAFARDIGWKVAKSEDIGQRVSPFTFRPVSIMKYKSAKIVIKSGWKNAPRHFSDV